MWGNHPRMIPLMFDISMSQSSRYQHKVTISAQCKTIESAWEKVWPYTNISRYVIHCTFKGLYLLYWNGLTYNTRINDYAWEVTSVHVYSRRRIGFVGNVYFTNITVSHEQQFMAAFKISLLISQLTRLLQGLTTFLNVYTWGCGLCIPLQFICLLRDIGTCFHQEPYKFMERL